MLREFPGGLVVRIPGFHCRGLGETEIMQAAGRGQKKKRRWRWSQEIQALGSALATKWLSGLRLLSYIKLR